MRQISPGPGAQYIGNQAVYINKDVTADTARRISANHLNHFSPDRAES
ncbi:MAG: hypothetical protein ACI3ZS_01910 [Candidatus Cryptobacteroides sp.]